MNFHYIAIEREYGSGGSKIVRLLSKKTGVPCYGREILEIAAKKENFSLSEVERYEESVTNSLLYSLYAFSQAAQSDQNMLTNEGKLYMSELNVTRNIAAKGPVIFLGHCAADMLKGQKKLLRIFIKADMESKRNGSWRITGSKKAWLFLHPNGLIKSRRITTCLTPPKSGTICNSMIWCLTAQLLGSTVV